MPYRVETRFQLRRYRDLPPFLVAVLREIGGFRIAPGAEAMWLKGRLWKLQAGSYSEWIDRDSMLAYARAGGHRDAARRTQSHWAEATWISLDDAPPSHFQSCTCGRIVRGPEPAAACPDCGNPLSLRLGAAAARPRRGIPFTPRISPGRSARRRLARTAGTICRNCGSDNEPGLAYCVRCGSRTRGTRLLVAGSTRLELYVFVGALLVTAVILAVAGAGALHKPTP